MYSIRFSPPKLSFLFLLMFFPFTFSDPRIAPSGLFCGKTKASTSTFVSSFVKEMETLSQLITTSHFATYHVNISSKTSPIYALAQCHHDLSRTDCLQCFAASCTKLPRCLPSISARIYLDGCFLRYDKYSFYNEYSSPLDRVKCGAQNVADFENEKDFVTSVRFAVDNVTRKAVGSGGFGVVSAKGVYALAQCWESVGKDGCRQCLEKAGNEVGKCGMKKEGRAMNAGCYLRYSTEKFFDDGGETGIDHGNRDKTIASN